MKLNSRRGGCSRKENEMFCHSSVPIQDYMPRHYAFSFGFYCTDKTRKSLKGLTYNVTIHSQTNETTCSAMPVSVPVCSQYYTQVAHPNLIDHEDIEDAVESFSRKYFAKRYLHEEYKNLLNCYQHFDEAVC